MVEIIKTGDDVDPAEAEKERIEMTNNIISISTPAVIMLGILISSGTFAVTIAKDREAKLRYLLNLAGIKPTAYYLGILITDFIIYIIPMALLVVLCFILDIKDFTDNAGKIFGSLCCAALPVITLTYCIQFAFATGEKAFTYAFLIAMVSCGLPAALLAIDGKVMYGL